MIEKEIENGGCPDAAKAGSPRSDETCDEARKNITGCFRSGLLFPNSNKTPAR